MIITNKMKTRIKNRLKRVLHEEKIEYIDMLRDRAYERISFHLDKEGAENSCLTVIIPKDERR